MSSFPSVVAPGRRPRLARSALAAWIVVLAAACGTQGKPPPPAPDLTERMALATERALGLHLETTAPVLAALEAFSGRVDSFESWSALDAAWAADPVLGRPAPPDEPMIPGVAILGALAEDEDWPKPPETVPLLVLKAGFQEGAGRFIAEARR